MRYGAIRRSDEAPHLVYDDEGLADHKARVPGYTKTMDMRYDEIKDDENYDAYERVVMLAFMQTPVTKDVLEELIKNDIYFPFEFLLFRPRITHAMATGILLKAGAETGETLIGHADFQLADDVVRKMHYGNFTLYSKSIVYKSDNVYLAENIVSTGYLHGNDVTFNTLDSIYADEASGQRSIYAAMVPVSSATGEDGVAAAHGYFNPMDVTGHFATNVPHLQDLDREVGNSRGGFHYPGAPYYSCVWQMNNSNQQPETEFVLSQLNAHNTMCFQGHQTVFNPQNNTFDMTTVNTGHFGERIYPGCGRVRRMAGQKYLEPVSYTSAFGAHKQLVNVGV